MEPTQVKAGKDPMLPVATARPQPQVYQRAPTLMAGASPGSQGQVQVWAPQKRLFWLGMSSTGPLSILLAALNLLTHTGTPAYVLAAIYLSSALLCCIPVLYHMRYLSYISTDEAGIAFTTRKGSQAYYWRDILSFERKVDDCWLTLQLTTGKAYINMSGYSRETQKKLLAVMARRLYPRSELPRPNESG